MEECDKGIFLRHAVGAIALAAGGAGITFSARVALDGFGCEEFAAFFIGGD